MYVVSMIIKDRITVKVNPHTPSDRILSQGSGHCSSEASVSSSVLMLFINLPGKVMEIPRNQNIGKSCISYRENKDTLWWCHWRLFWVSDYACLASRWESWRSSWLPLVGWAHRGKTGLMHHAANLDRSFCWLNRNNATMPWNML